MSDDDLVRSVARRHGMAPRSVTRLGGVVNRVYRVSGPEADWVVRLPVDLRDDVFGVEAWAMAAAEGVGIATPELVATGTVDGVPYMVAGYVPPADDEVDVPWTWLGTCARRVAGSVWPVLRRGSTRGSGPTWGRPGARTSTTTWLRWRTTTWPGRPTARRTRR